MIADQPVVLYVGKLSPGKGIWELRAVAEQVTQRVPARPRFVVAGPGDPAPLAKSLADFRILGPQSRAEVEALYDGCDVVLCPANWPEPFSRVPLEAAMHGKPVVATDVGGMREVIEPYRTGLLAPRGDVGRMAWAVSLLLTNPSAARGLGAQARQRVGERFSAARGAAALLEVYGR